MKAAQYNNLQKGENGMYLDGLDDLDQKILGISLKLISTMVPPCFDTLKLMGSYLLGTWKFAP